MKRGDIKSFVQMSNIQATCGNNDAVEFLTN